VKFLISRRSEKLWRGASARTKRIELDVDVWSLAAFFDFAEASELPVRVSHCRPCSRERLRSLRPEASAGDDVWPRKRRAVDAVLRDRRERRLIVYDREGAIGVAGTFDIAMT